MRKLLLGFLMGAFATNAFADEVAIDMWTLDPSTHERNDFNPGVIFINPGDTVVWTAKEVGHNVELLTGAVPEGIEKFRSGFDKEIRYTFQQDGIYAYKCLPHFGLGMIGFIVVGNDFSNLNSIKAYRYPGLAKARAEGLLSQLDQMRKETNENVADVD